MASAEMEARSCRLVWPESRSGPETPLQPKEEEQCVLPKLAEARAQKIRRTCSWRGSASLILSACGVALVVACLYTAHRWSAGPAPSAVGDAVGFRRDEGMLHWRGYAHKCLDVEGVSTATGTRVQLWTCHADNRNEKFIFPRMTGMIHWAAHPHLCLHVNGGNLEVGTHIVLDHCHKEYRAMQWTMPDGDGPIRLRYHPDLCIDEHNTHLAGNGFDALLGNCSQDDANVSSDRVWKEVMHEARGQLHWKPHNSKSCLRVRRPVVGEPLHTGDCNVRSMQTQFIFPAQTGVIRYAPYPHLCLHATKDNREIHLGHCRTEQKSMQWEVPNGAGPVRMLHEKNRCLNAVQLQGKVRTHTCDNVSATAHWNFVATPRKKWGSPSLLCWAVMMAGSYEETIFKSQLARATGSGHDFGIFDCDEFHVLSVKRRKLGWHHEHGWVRTQHFHGAFVGRSSDNTAGNAMLFKHAWASVRRQGRYLHHPWTIKSDPDCVVIPDRLRNSLRPHTAGPPSFVTNCNAFPGSPNFPTIYGALEAYSKHALTNYFGRVGECLAMPWQAWGEDKFMTKCMQRLGMYQVNDFSLVGDNACVQTNCNTYHAAYHPYKTPDQWFGCYYTATR